MKKILVLGLLSLTALSVLPQQLFAFKRCWRCCRCTQRIIVRPYNAFTPVCCGSITGIGCNPLSLGCCAPGAGFMGCGPGPCMPSCFTGGCCYGGVGAPPGALVPPPP